MSRDVNVYRITSVQPGPTAEQRRREVVYLTMMGIRAVAIVVAVVTPGFWRLVAVIAGIVLPYVAVVLANAVHVRDLEATGSGFTPTEIPGLADTPFQGMVVPDDARDLDDD